MRALAGVAAYLLTQLTDVSFLEDALWYEYLGYRVAEDWLAGRPGGLDTLSSHGQMVWVMVAAVAALYFVLGGVRAVPLLMVLYSAVTALVPVYVYFIGRELGMMERAARRAGWLVALSPAFVFWSGSLYKEGLILLVLSITVYHTLRLQAQWQARSLVVLVAAVAALFGLRFYLGVLMTMVVATGLLLARRGGMPAKAATRAVPTLVRQACIALVFVGMVGVLGINESAERRLLETQEGVLLEIDRTRQWLAATGQSGYVPEADVSTLEDATEFFPIGLFYFLTVPLPWQTGRLRQNLVIPETAFWLLLYPFILVGFVRGLRVNRPGTLIAAAATVGMCIIYALLSGNVGTAYRMRSQVWLLWAPFAAWGWEVWQQRREQVCGAQREARVARLAARRRRLLGARVI